MSSIADSLSSGINRVKDTAERWDRNADLTGLLVWKCVPSLHGQGGKIDRNNDVKGFTKGAAHVTKQGISVAQLATGNSGISGVAVKSAIGGGVGAVSSTGVGLIAAAGGIAVVKSGFAAYSAYKTHNHIVGLEAIFANWQSYECDHCAQYAGEDWVQHRFIANTVLPAIIRKKKTKRARKGVSAVPVVGGMIAGFHSGVHSIQKRWNGTRGKERHYHAEALAVHLITHKCQLAEAIVAELFSPEEMEQIKRMNSDRAGPKICKKISSM